jgi:hypothetical protein
MNCVQLIFDMLIGILLYGVYFRIGNGSRGIPDAEVGESGPSKVAGQNS